MDNFNLHGAQVLEHGLNALVIDHLHFANVIQRLHNIINKPASGAIEVVERLLYVLSLLLGLEHVLFRLMPEVVSLGSHPQPLEDVHDRVMLLLQLFFHAL